MISAICRFGPGCGRRGDTRSAGPTTCRRRRRPCCRRDRARARGRARHLRAGRSRHTRCASDTRSRVRPRERPCAPDCRSDAPTLRAAFAKNNTTSCAPRAWVRNRTPSGNGFSSRSNPSGARTNAKRAPGLIPSFWGRAFPEYPATWRSQSRLEAWVNQAGSPMRQRARSAAPSSRSLRLPRDTTIRRTPRTPSA